MGKVGNETSADMKGDGAMGSRGGSVVGQSNLMTAVEHLHAEHPISQAAKGTKELGPHQGTNHHERHMPMAGLKPSKGEM